MLGAAVDVEADVGSARGMQRATEDHETTGVVGVDHRFEVRWMIS